MDRQTSPTDYRKKTDSRLNSTRAGLFTDTRRPTNPNHNRREGRPGVRGVVPRESIASPTRATSKTSEYGATPGGYGGKPPGVAFIGVPTGARNAGRVLRRGTRAPI